MVDTTSEENPDSGSRQRIRHFALPCPEGLH